MAPRDRLPVIPISLRKTDPDVPLDLPSLIDQSYRNGGYDDLDYTVGPDPPPDPDDADWAAAILHRASLRRPERLEER